MTGPLSRGTVVAGTVVPEDGMPVGRLLHRCPECGELHTLDVDPVRLRKWLAEYPALPHVQDYWPELSPAEREEFFMTGTCGKCCDRMLGEEEP